MKTAYTNFKAESISQIIPLMHDEIESLFTQKEDDNKVVRIAIETPEINPIDWLKKQSDSSKIFWSDRSGRFRSAGVGEAKVFQNGNEVDHQNLFDDIQILLANSDENVRLFGGFCFDPTTEISEEWNKFGSSRFVLPRFELIIFDKKYSLVCNIIPSSDSPEKIIEQLHRLNFDKIDNSYSSKIISRNDIPNYDGWGNYISESLEDIQNRKFEKIVLARKSELHFDNQPDPLEIVGRLLDNTSSCFHFCFQLDSGQTFLGASPERLYFRDNDRLECDAIAGTCPRGNNDEESSRLAQELLASEKDNREHHYVVKNIVEALTPLTDEELNADSIPVHILQLARLQHLMSRIEINIKKGIGDYHLINALHPTAAVGGYPNKKALSTINRLEQFDRGWYAAPVGWIGKNSAEFAVAIRSGLLDKNKLSLYSGAGIIDGSKPESEWEEIENKISSFLKALN